MLKNCIFFLGDLKHSREMQKLELEAGMLDQCKVGSPQYDAWTRYGDR